MTRWQEQGGPTGQAWAALERSAGPPSFCRWPSVLGVATVSLLAAAMVLLGTRWPVTPSLFFSVLAYALVLSLFCIYVVCAFRGILERLSTRGAWIGAWVTVVLCALGFSYAVGMVGSVLGVGPAPAVHSAFVAKSVIGAALVSLAMFRYLYVSNRWQAEMLSESEARVEALQARIRPHFLFNSLNTIASLIHDDPDGAERATEDLADLFRGGMRGHEDLVPLADELALARKYLAMEERRLGDRLQVEWAVEDLPADEPVLPLLLQPLLENAVTHGVQRRDDGGTVQVFGRREGGQLVVTVTNPLAPGESAPGNGMALGNIRSRLALSYSSLASLTTHEDGQRFYAVLSLPHAQTADR